MLIFVLFGDRAER
jgi:uncharacterized membrane protein HdeD (DUF308 family)